MNLQKKTWTHGLTLQDFEEHEGSNAKVGRLCRTDGQRGNSCSVSAGNAPWHLQGPVGACGVKAEYAHHQIQHFGDRARHL